MVQLVEPFENRHSEWSGGQRPGPSYKGPFEYRTCQIKTKFPKIAR
jgi:hypothetical protein